MEFSDVFACPERETSCREASRRHKAPWKRQKFWRIARFNPVNAYGGCEGAEGYVLLSLRREGNQGAEEARLISARVVLTLAPCRVAGQWRLLALGCAV